MDNAKIAVFASGNGTNAVNLIKYFKKSNAIDVAFVFCNVQQAPVIDLAKKEGVNVIVQDNQFASQAENLIDMCRSHQVDYIVLAGYLRLIPEEFIDQYQGKIINLHPSILPDFGGKGMYGNFVHQAVIENKVSYSGITIHFVDKEFDKGSIIAQFRCHVHEGDDVDALRQKISVLEQVYFPIVIEKTIQHASIF